MVYFEYRKYTAKEKNPTMTERTLQGTWVETGAGAGSEHDQLTNSVTHIRLCGNHWASEDTSASAYTPASCTISHIPSHNGVELHVLGTAIGHAVPMTGPPRTAYPR